MSAVIQRVLLVEDNDDNRYLARVLLEAEGLEVVEVPDGVSAVDLARAETFDLVLLDLQLPGMDGFEVARQIRRGSSCDAPIIAVSAFAMSSDRRRAFAAGCVGYIEKPIEADNFVPRLRALAQVPGV